jgi:hypothetical protein
MGFSYMGFQTWFLGRRWLEIIDVWSLGGPGGPKTPLQKVGGFAPHLLERCFEPPGAPEIGFR